MPPNWWLVCFLDMFICVSRCVTPFLDLGCRVPPQTCSRGDTARHVLLTGTSRTAIACSFVRFGWYRRHGAPDGGAGADPRSRSRHLVYVTPIFPPLPPIYLPLAHLAQFPLALQFFVVPSHTNLSTAATDVAQIKAVTAVMTRSLSLYLSLTHTHISPPFLLKRAPPPIQSC